MLLAALTALFMGLGYMLGGSGGAIIALLVAAGMNLVTFWNADKIVLSMHNAREVDAHSAPEFYGLVRDLAQRAGLPMPRVYLIDQPAPNAFATGRDPDHAAVAATTGLLATLNRDEVAGVLHHPYGALVAALEAAALLEAVASLLRPLRPVAAWPIGPTGWECGSACCIARLDCGCTGRATFSLPTNGMDGACACSCAGAP